MKVNDRVKAIVDLTNEYLFGDDDEGKDNVVVPSGTEGVILKVDFLWKHSDNKETWSPQDSVKVRFDNGDTWWVDDILGRIDNV